MSKRLSKQREPIRCFEGNAKPHEPFWVFRNVAESEEPEMELYGYISEYSWFDDDITPAMFKDDLYAHGNGGPITIRINSYGGDVIAASLMNTIIRDYPGKVTVQVDGIAASAATVVAVAGDHLRIQETGYLMVHDPAMVFFLAQINLEDMGRMTEALKSIKEGIVNAYETKTGLSRTRLSKLMTDETWMDAQKALDLGFVDEVLRGGEKSFALLENAAAVNALGNFTNVPPAVMQAIKMSDQPQEEVDSSEPLLTEDEQREAQSLRDQIQSILLRKE
jgi:ATP-dependent Clp protease protease subunit